MKELNNMLLISGMWQGVPTFKMIPVTEDCPYIEVVFMPRDRVLAVVSKVKEDRYQMIHRLDNKGNTIPINGKKDEKGEQLFEMQRVVVNTYHDYYVVNPIEMEKFVERFAVNGDSYPYKQLIELAFAQSTMSQSVIDPTVNKPDAANPENTVDFNQAKKELEETPADNTSA